MSELLFEQYLPKRAACLQACKRNQLALLSTSTNVKLSPALRAAIGCTKVIYNCTKYVRLNANYLALVNEERKQHGMEPLKKTGPLPWGEWVIPNILLAHQLEVGNEPKFYLRYYRETSGKYEYDGDAEYIIDDVVFPSSHPTVKAIIEDRKARMHGIRPMCNNVSWENIVSLDLCDNLGQPDTAIV